MLGACLAVVGCGSSTQTTSTATRSTPARTAAVTTTPPGPPASCATVALPGGRGGRPPPPAPAHGPPFAAGPDRGRDPAPAGTARILRDRGPAGAEAHAPPRPAVDHPGPGQDVPRADQDQLRDVHHPP